VNPFTARNWYEIRRVPYTTTTMTTTLKLMLVFVCCFLLACPGLAGEQHITVQYPFGVYTATVDDSLLPRMKLQLLPVFSPLVDTSVPLNTYLTAIGNPYDKVMLSPKLEDCQHGDPNCPPTTVTDAFLGNAEANLEKGRKQVRDLQSERLPKSLEPVRRFLLDNLKTTLRMEEARYEYIRTGGVVTLKAMADQYCTTSQPGLIRKLEEAPDAEMRRELSLYEWYNAVWQCYRERSDKYPAEAWKQFVRENHVREATKLLE
jgi:hypothetical protein